MSLLHILQPQQEMGACSLLWMLIHQARGSYENHITHLSGHNHEQVLNRNVIWYNIEDGRTNTRILHYNCIGEKKNHYEQWRKYHACTQDKYNTWRKTCIKFLIFKPIYKYKKSCTSTELVQSDIFQWVQVRVNQK